MRYLYYTLSEWTAWPECDICEYASEIATFANLGSKEARYLENAMLERAGIFPVFAQRSGPFKLTHDLERSMLDLDPEADVFAQNRQMNKPREKLKPPSIKHRIVGSGLTKRQIREVDGDGWLEKESKRSRHRFAKKPFTHLLPEVEATCNEALWQAGCYRYGQREWLIREGNKKPYEGLVWYAWEILQTYGNARHQGRLGNIEGAMFHSFRAGTLLTELQMRLAHGELFDRFSATHSAQSEAAKARKIVSDEARREAYFRYRQQGNKRIEAGRLAGRELGLSEASIRSAFPDNRYPPE